MIALINYDNKKYYSHIFALMKNEDKRLAVVFDVYENKFALLNVYDSKYMSNKNVTLFDDNAEGMIEKESIQLTSFKATACLGYEWLLNNSELLNAIEQGKQIDKKYIDLANQLNATIDLDKWHEITNEKDAQSLMDIAGGFHDSYIVGMNYKGSSNDINLTTKIQVIFELRDGISKIALEFYGCVDIHYSFDPIFNGVYSSSIVFGKNCIYWVEGDNEYKLSDIDEQSLYFKSEHLRWKMIPKIV